MSSLIPPRERLLPSIPSSDGPFAKDFFLMKNVMKLERACMLHHQKCRLSIPSSMGTYGKEAYERSDEITFLFFLRQPANGR
jgi:hypothetical protein